MKGCMSEVEIWPFMIAETDMAGYTVYIAKC